ncbi:MAG: ATP-binding protein [Candidatus Omnitrophota bacterium]
MLIFSAYSIPPFISAILIILLGIYVWNKNIKSGINFGWFLFCLSLFIWQFSDAILFSTTNKILANFLSRSVYLGVGGLPFSCLYFTAKITGIKLKKIVTISLLVGYLTLVYFLFKTNTILAGFYTHFWGFYPKAGNYHYMFQFIWSVLVILVIYIIYKKINQPNITSSEKQQLYFALYPFVLGTIIGPIDFLGKYGLEIYPLGYFCIPLMIICMCIGIFKHQIMGIRVALQKSLIYSILIAILTGIYLLLIVGIEWLFKNIIGYTSLPVSLVATFIIAILFNPLRNKIQKIIDRLFLGKTTEEFATENKLLHHELEKSQRLKVATTMALGLAHEVKNPLTTIKTFSEYIKDKYKDKDDEFFDKFNKLIPSEVERINNIIHRLLDFSKPAEPNLKPTNIANLIKDILEFLNNEFLKNKIKVHEEYENPELLIHIDSNQIKQVLLNLILNSIEAMPKGGEIFISVASDKNTSTIEIKDTGCGISKKALDNIFNPFFTTKHTGSGLGLSICRQIIQNHNGTIEVESEVDKGSIFRIKIPQK